MNGRAFSDAEIIAILAFYPELGCRRLARALGRDHTSIAGKLAKLGIGRQRERAAYHASKMAAAPVGTITGAAYR